MPKKLNQLEATAICGNDISSSCLYVSAIAIVYAGQYAWISLLVVAGVLYLFRSIYGEVVGALPLNGGAYNALLNTTKKSTASLAAALTVLSYMATAVISASEAIKYANSLLGFLPIIAVTIGLLLLFMGLVILGIGESSKVAIFIFLFHLLSLILLSIFCLYHFIDNGFEILLANFKRPVEGGILTALFFGFSAAMLGISGFESSANYVEEQQDGVFPKTLRNMWIVVTIFNPLIAFLALTIIPIGDVNTHQDALLSYMGSVSGGTWLSVLVGIDAALVLSGAVLTSYVGVGGLMERMALDRILPKFILKKNKRGNSYRIYIFFFVICTSILMVTQGNLAKLAGVYTIAFLSVMVLFGIGNLLLKIKRARLPRLERSSWPGLLLAIAAIITAIIGNIVLNPEYLGIFIEYLIPTLLVIGAMLYSTQLLKGLLMLLDYLTLKDFPFFKRINTEIKRSITRINSQQFVFFTNHDDVAVLNTVLQYISANEHTKKLKIVAVVNKEDVIAPKLRFDVEVLDRAYPQIIVDFIEEEGIFGPEKIKELSKRWKIPVNFMFIGSPGNKFPYRIQELGDVRLII